MKNLLLSCALLLALVLPFRSLAVGPPEVVIVRIYEGGTITAIISRGPGKSEKVEFGSGITDKHLTQAAEGYQALFERFYREGYALKNTFTSAVNEGASYVTLVFTKEQ